jgi:hypothetical protein
LFAIFSWGALLATARFSKAHTAQGLVALGGCATQLGGLWRATRRAGQQRHVLVVVRFAQATGMGDSVRLDHAPLLACAPHEKIANTL